MYRMCVLWTIARMTFFRCYFLLGQQIIDYLHTVLLQIILYHPFQLPIQAGFTYCFSKLEVNHFSQLNTYGCDGFYATHLPFCRVDKQKVKMVQILPPPLVFFIFRYIIPSLLHTMHALYFQLAIYPSRHSNCATVFILENLFAFLMCVVAPVFSVA